MRNADPVEVMILDERIRQWGLPRYQSEMSAAIDLFACVDSTLVLEAQTEATLISAGIAVHIADPTLAAIIAPRSGLGHRKGLVLGNLIGILDADYTGPILVSAWNRNGPGSAPIVINAGDRIAQLMFVPIVRPVFCVVDQFSTDTARGAGGFGSTGDGHRAFETGRDG